jgi:hypothetical protein
MTTAWPLGNAQSFTADTDEPSADDGTGAWWDLPLHERVYAGMPLSHEASIGAALSEVGADFWALQAYERMYFHCALAGQEACGEISLPPEHPLISLAGATRLPYQEHGADDFDRPPGEQWFELLPGVRLFAGSGRAVRFQLSSTDGVHAALLHLSRGRYRGELPARLRTKHFAMELLPLYYGVESIDAIPSSEVVASAREIMMRVHVEESLAGAPIQSLSETAAPPRRRRMGA